MAQLQNKSQSSEDLKEVPKQDVIEVTEPAKKMRKVVIAEVEMLVEEGSTITIGGVAVKF